MKNWFAWLKEECLNLLPVVLFFFIIFFMADISRSLMHETTSATYYRFLVIALAALMMGKVVFIADHLPCINNFSDRPLIYNTLWKTLIYLICSFFVLILDHLLPFYLEKKNLSVAYQKLTETMERPQFWMSFAWLGLVLLIFVAYRELIGAIGKDKVYKMFFGK